MASQLTKIKQQTFHHKFYNHLMFCLVAEKCQKATINYYRTSENKKKNRKPSTTISSVFLGNRGTKSKLTWNVSKWSFLIMFPSMANIDRVRIAAITCLASIAIFSFSFSKLTLSLAPNTHTRDTLKTSSTAESTINAWKTDPDEEKYKNASMRWRQQLQLIVKKIQHRNSHFWHMLLSFLLFYLLRRALVHLQHVKGSGWIP